MRETEATKITGKQACKMREKFYRDHSYFFSVSEMSRHFNVWQDASFIIRKVLKFGKKSHFKVWKVSVERKDRTLACWNNKAVLKLKANNSFCENAIAVCFAVKEMPWKRFRHIFQEYLTQ